MRLNRLSRYYPKNRRDLAILVVVGALLAAVLGFIAWRLGLDVQTLREVLQAVLQFLEGHPLLLFLAIMTLPGVGFPSSALLILAGIVYGAHFGVVPAIVIAQAAITVCMTWTYFLTAFPLRRFTEKLLASANIPLPNLSQKGYNQIVLLVRATPGIPFVFQNIVLGLLKVPLIPYLLISTGVLLFYTSGFAVFGKALIEGNLMLLITALVILTAAAMAVRALLNRSKKGDELLADTREEGGECR